jgi:hypothetical protein
MRKASLEELRGQISAGDYGIDSGKVAADILRKFSLIGRVRQLLVDEEDEGAEDDRRGSEIRPRRGGRPGPSESLRRATNAYRRENV